MFVQSAIVMLTVAVLLSCHARYVRQDNNTPQSAREAHHDRSVRPCSSRHGLILACSVIRSVRGN